MTALLKLTVTALSHCSLTGRLWTTDGPGPSTAQVLSQSSQSSLPLPLSLLSSRPATSTAQAANIMGCLTGPAAGGSDAGGGGGGGGGGDSGARHVKG